MRPVCVTVCLCVSLCVSMCVGHVGPYVVQFGKTVGENSVGPGFDPPLRHGFFPCSKGRNLVGES